MAFWESSSALRRYGLAVALVGFISAVRLAFDPVLANVPLLIFVLPITASVRLGGRKSGFAATILSALSGWYFFTDPRYSLLVPDITGWFGLAVLTMCGLVISVVVARVPEQSSDDALGDGRPALPRGPTFRRSLFWGCGIVALLILTRLLYSDSKRQLEYQEYAKRHYILLHELGELRSTLEAIDTNTRGYLLTADSRYLIGFERASEDSRSALLKLRKRTADNPLQSQRLDKLGLLVNTRVSAVREGIKLRQEAMKPGQTKGFTDALADMRRVEGTMQNITEVGAVLRMIEGEEYGLLVKLSHQVADQTRNTRWVLGLGSGSLLCLLLVAGRVIENDIQNRERDQQEKRNNAERLRYALEAAEAGAWERDLQTGVCVWSDEVWNLFGLEPHSCEPSFESWRQAIHPDDRERVTQEVIAGGKSGSEMSIEFRAGGRDGNPNWLLARARPIADKEGRVRRFTGIVLNITRKKQAEEAARESETQFRTLANAIPQLCWIANANGWIFWYNERWYEYTGTTPEQMSGWGWQSVHDPAILPQVLDRWKASIASGEPFDMVFPLLGADGRLRPFLTRIMPVRDRYGNVVRWFGTNTDITEQRKIEDALRLNYRQLQASFDGMVEPALLLDPEANILAINSAFLRLFEYQTVPSTRDDLVRDFEFTSSEQSLMLDRDPYSHALKGEVIRDSEFKVRNTATGRCIHTICGSAPVRDASGQMVAIIFTSHDITERKRAELALESSNHALRQFAYAAAHDLQEPLRNISTSSQLLLRFYEKTLDNTAHQLLETNVEGAIRMSSMVKDLLAFTKVIEGVGTATPFTHSKAALAQALTNLDMLIKEAGAQITYESLPTVPMHKLHLTQLFQNLVANSIKYRHPDRIPQIHISAEEQDGSWLFTVSDNGIGFDPIYRQRIFGVFKRLHGRDKYEGTGIGLAICSRIVEHYGGRIWADGVPGLGATFYFSTTHVGTVNECERGVSPSRIDR